VGAVGAAGADPGADIPQETGRPCDPANQSIMRRIRASIPPAISVLLGRGSRRGRRPLQSSWECSWFVRLGRTISPRWGGQRADLREWGYLRMSNHRGDRVQPWDMARVQSREGRNGMDMNSRRPSKGRQLRPCALGPWSSGIGRTSRRRLGA
jgi:hypothetical protein